MLIWWGACLASTEPWLQSPDLPKYSMVAQTCNLSTAGMKSEKFGVVLCYTGNLRPA